MTTRMRLAGAPGGDGRLVPQFALKGVFN